MPRVAVVAHAGKGPEGGLVELRQVLAREGVADPLWYEVTKSRKAADAAAVGSIFAATRLSARLCSNLGRSFSWKL